MNAAFFRVLRAVLTLYVVVCGMAGAATYTLSLANGTNVNGGGACATTLNSQCRYRNVVQGNPPAALQRDLIVTVSKLQGGASIATGTAGVNAFDNDALQLTPFPSTTPSGPIRADMFAPTVRAPATAGATSWVEYTFQFVTPGTTTASALPGTFFITSFDTDGSGQNPGTVNGLREFVEFTAPTRSGLATSTNVKLDTAVNGGTNYTAKFTDNQSGVGDGEAYKVSAQYENVSTFKLTVGARQGTPACTGIACDRLSAYSFQIAESVLTSPVVDGYKSVRLTTDADRSGSITAGDTLTWTVTYVNTGNANVTEFQITDTLPGNVTFTAGTQTVTAGAGSTALPNAAYTGAGTNTGLLATGATLAANSTITVTIPVVVGAGATSTTLSNQASAAGTGLTTTPSDNVDSTTTFAPSVTASAGWTAPAADSVMQTQTNAVEATTVAVVASPYNLTVSKTDGQTSVVTGTSTTYTVRVTNNGTASTAGATLRDPAVMGLTVTGVTCSAAVGNTCTTAPTTAQLQGTPGIALPTLAPGAFYEVQVTATVTAAAGANVTNTATVALAAGQNDAVPGDNTASDTNSVLPTPDLTLTKTGPQYARPSTVANTDPAAGPVVAAQDSFISYTLTVNTANASATGTTTVTDTLPAGLSWAGGSANYTAGPGTWTCGVSGQTITCTTPGPIVVGTPQTITLRNVRVDPGTAAGATFTNTATVSNPNEAAADNNAGNTGTATTRLILTQVSKQVRMLPGGAFGTSASVRPGDLLEYCIDTRNLGGADLANYVLSDTLNSNGRSLTSVTTDPAYGGKAIKWTRTPASGTATSSNATAAAGDDAGTLTDTSLSVNLGTLAAGETVRTCFQVQVR
ncbi:isopeptide-forming domain-containing fimbrial protein [Deinococcus sp. S9]|uniref:beta strand repeat-containing protein n=1 Tax=Deinococcus sp. S9 TaxID=2545754 RepID=UPI001054846B|nr:isopeptide-forming domain-containing fimbrial protein [Deinococcus sp. S9]TDE84877.1 isopeptide-forming domain-containing fimbrial protein [Deinococcus sp. S9]